MTKRVLLAGVGLLLMTAVGVSEAFVRTRTAIGRPLYWEPKTAAMVVHPINRNWSAEVQRGVNAWNRAGSQFSFTTRVSSFAPLCAADDIYINSIEFSRSLCGGRQWGTRTLAVTVSRFLLTGRILDMKILFNANLTWGAYDGPLRYGVNDFRRVLLHELGHVLGLDHPDDHGQRRNAIMNADASAIFTLQPDDIAGIRAIYEVAQTAPSPTVPPAPLANLENPQANAFKSGIGIISGWACTARTVEVQVDTYPRIPLVYGTPRGDTRSVCGDTNNGFVTLVNWNLFGTGRHTIRLYVDGSYVRSAPFTVTRLGGEFVRGLQGSFLLPDFPSVGRDTSIRWEESSQNFVIDGVR